MHGLGTRGWWRCTNVNEAERVGLVSASQGATQALGWAHHVWDHGDPFFDVRRLTWVTYLIAGYFLVRYNIAHPRYWPNLCREVWVPLRAKMKNRWPALHARDSAT